MRSWSLRSSRSAVSCRSPHPPTTSASRSGRIRHHYRRGAGRFALKPEIARVFAENFAVYGVRKVWRQMMREGFQRCDFIVSGPVNNAKFGAIMDVAHASKAIGTHFFLCPDEAQSLYNGLPASTKATIAFKDFLSFFSNASTGRPTGFRRPQRRSAHR